MTTGVCSRCGASGTVEYGADGMMYCSSCAFYGLNKQCWRCRMYLPASELQQYRGQLTCPNCIQDIRAESVKAEEHVERKPHLEAIQLPEQCERCGRDLRGMVYIWNDRKLCKHCVEDEQQKWGTVGGGPMAAPYRITLGPERRRKKMSLIEAFISDILHLLGIRKKKEVEVVVVGGRIPIAGAKPMAERPMEGPAKAKEVRRPQAEGIMALEKPAEQKAGAAALKPPREAGGAAPIAAATASEELSRVVPARKGVKKGRAKGKRGPAGGAPGGEKKKQ